MKNKEKRFFPIELRTEEKDGQEAPMIVGTAAVYNSRSVDLGGFTEVIEPGFFDNVLGGDTRALLNHDPNYLLGRTTAETLRLLDQESGLGFQADPPDTQTIRDLVLIPMKRGDLNQCSFAFTVAKGGDEWRELPDGGWERRLKPCGCDGLYDISVVTYAAYPETDSEVLERFQKIKAGEDPGPAAHDLPDNQAFADAPAGKAIRIKKFEVMKAQVKEV